MATFPEKLDREMRRMGLGQAALARAVGCTVSIVRHWLDGRIPAPDRLLALSRYFGRSMEWWIDDNHDAESQAVDLKPDERYVLQGYREAVRREGLTATQAVVRMHAEPLRPRKPDE